MVECHLVRSIYELDGFMEKLRAASRVAFDYETYTPNNAYKFFEGKKRPIDFHNTRVAGLSIAFDDWTAYYLPFCHANTQNLQPFVLEDVCRTLKGKEVVCHNLKFEYKVSKVNGVPFPMEMAEDTMLLADEYDNNLPGSLKELSKVFQSGSYKDDLPEDPLRDLVCGVLGCFVYPEDLVDHTYLKSDLVENNAAMNLRTGDDVYRYACMDAIYTLKLYWLFMQHLDEDPYLHYKSVELPLIKVIGDMELEGVNFDLERCHEEMKHCAAIIQDLEQQVYTECGRQFNCASPKQVSDVLFNDLKLSPLKVNKTGFSCDKHVLELLRDEHPVIDLLIKRNQYATIQKMFLSKLPLMVHSGTGRIHPEFWQGEVVTGRLSCRRPNLQQLRKDAMEGGEENVRALFIPDNPNHVIVSLDLAGVELRLCAILNGEKAMLEAFKRDEDLHTKTAIGIFGPNPTKAQRKMAKIVNFLILYGGGAGALARTITKRKAWEILTDEEKAYYSVFPDPHREIMEDFIKKWNTTYPDVARYKSRLEDKIWKNRYAQEFFGRRRYFTLTNWADKFQMFKAFRTGHNHEIQGTCASMMKLIMADVAKKFPDLHILMTIHDELVLSIPVEKVHDSVVELYKIFTDWAFDIKIYSTVSVGKNFGEMVEYKKESGDFDYETFAKDWKEAGRESIRSESTGEVATK